jgi:HK97 family phage prohead protease
MSATLVRAFTSDLEVRTEGDGRTIAGILAPFGKTARVNDGSGPYLEGFDRGAFAKTIRDRADRVKLFANHSHRTGGMAIGTATLLREDASGLYGELHIAGVPAGDEALTLVRDGAADSFSVGFMPIKSVTRGRVTWRTEVKLREVSLTSLPAYEDARVLAVRSELDGDDAELFDRLSAEGYSDEYITNALEIVRTHNLRSTVPVQDETTDGTPPGAADVDEPRKHSARQFATALFCRQAEERGI